LLAFFTVAGSVIGGHSTMGVAYPLFILASLSPWAFIATSLSTSAAGMLASRSLIAKVYFPREILPLSYVFAALADLAIATALAIVALACAGYGVPATAFELLPISLILIIYATALSLLLSIVQIGFRDVAIGLPLLLQGLMLTTPVLYPLEAVPAQWRPIYALNPLALLVEAFRGALVGHQIVYADQLAYAGGLGLVLLGIAYFLFKTAELDMADEI
jgi:lipopolysaccharide transport system permease protein